MTRHQSPQSRSPAIPLTHPRLALHTVPSLTDQRAEHERRHLLHGYRVGGPVALEHLVRQDAGQLVGGGAGSLQFGPRRRLRLAAEQRLRLGHKVGQQNPGRRGGGGEAEVSEGSTRYLW